VTRLSPRWLAEPLTTVFAALGAPQIDVRAVGGCVRDAVLGCETAETEVDLGTPEPPDAVQKRLVAAGIQVVPTGLAHGTVMAVIAGRTFEITSLRQDTACDGRHATVAFTTDWAEDARRRDFTFNAMSMHPDGTLFDPYGGVADARAGRVRFVGAPADRIQEDYLRILRLFRFHARFGHEPLDAQTLTACAAHRAGLTRLSAERIQAELAKLLAAADPAASVAQMAAAGVLSTVLPAAMDDSAAALARLIHCEAAIGRPPAWLRRLAVVLPRGQGAAVATALKLSHAEGTQLVALTAPAPDIDPHLGAAELRAVLFAAGAELVLDRLLLAWAHTDDRSADWPALAKQIRETTVRPLPVSGSDVLARGLAPGPHVGRILRRLTDWWVAEAFAPSRDDALRALDQLIAENNNGPAGGSGAVTVCSGSGGETEP
jgi:poly(A) polymerase